MRITIHFFARARELAGTGETTLALPEGSTVAALRLELSTRFPALTPLLERSALAVEETLANNEQKLHSGAVVAVIPPVSGGSTR